MTDTIEAVAEAIRKHQAENRVWKMADLAQAAITAHTKALIEGAGELCTALKFHGRYGSENRDQMTVRKNGERDQAAATIAALKAEIERLTEREAQAKLDGVRGGIEAAAVLLERDDGFGEWWDAAQFVRSELDAEAIAKGIITAAALSDLIAEDADLIAPPYATKADSDGDDGA